MILPIKLTGQNGLQVGSGVPSFVMDPATGEILGGADASQSVDPNAVPPDMAITGGAIDPTTGEPATQESILAQQDAAQDFSNTTSVWDTSSPDASASAGAPASTDVLNTGALRNTRGTQWNRRGSYLTKSAFDNWRDAGRPTSCSLKGFGDVQTADRILQAIAVGANAAAQPTYPNYGTPYGPQVPGGQVTVSGAANPIVWIFGGVIVLGAAYLIGQRR